MNEQMGQTYYSFAGRPIPEKRFRPLRNKANISKPGHAKSDSAAMLTSLDHHSITDG